MSFGFVFPGQGSQSIGMLAQLVVADSGAVIRATFDEAQALGITGWVRNNHDGSVEVLAQGTRDQLSGLHSRLREGPRAARVDEVEVSEAKPTTGLNSFRIEGEG